VAGTEGGHGKWQKAAKKGGGLAAPERASLLINIHDHEWELLKPGGRVFFVQGKIPNPPERLKTFQLIGSIFFNKTDLIFCNKTQCEKRRVLYKISKI